MQENDEAKFCVAGVGCRVSLCLHEYANNGTISCIKCGEIRY